MLGSDPLPDDRSPRVPASRASAAMLVLAAALLAHAAATHAGVFDFPSWVPIVECLVASVIGLHQLRRLPEAGAVAPQASQAAVASAPPSSRPSAPSPVPARVAGTLDEGRGPAVGS
jgi:fatty acid desaturase